MQANCRAKVSKAELTFLTVSLFSSHRQDLESHIHLAIWLGSLQNNFTY